MSTSPLYATTPKRTIGQVSTAVTTYDAPSASGGAITNGLTLVTGATNGTLVRSIEVEQATNNAAACIIRVFYSADAGTTWRKYLDIYYPAQNVSGSPNTSATTHVVRYFDGLNHGDGNPLPTLVVPSGHKLACVTTVAQAMNVAVEAVDF